MTVCCCTQDLALTVVFPPKWIQLLIEPEAVNAMAASDRADHSSLEFCRESV